MEYRMEHDTMGEIAVPADKLWGAQTQRSFENFRIGSEKMPLPVIYALAAVKEAAAAVNERLGTDTEDFSAFPNPPGAFPPRTLHPTPHFCWSPVYTLPSISNSTS